ncbi:MAG: hypothetical protein M4579_000779 [Chaenotheca gracillima]|nr:MAG: hypothetical protein M4579_000779 [Chaenotheca gracillima]
MLPTLPQTKIEIPLSLSAKTPNVHKAKDLLNKSLPPSPHSSRIASPVSPEYENTRHGRQAPDTKSSTGLSTRFPSSPILPNIPKLPVLKVPSPKDVSAVERTKSNSRRRPPAPPPSPSPRTPPTSPNVDQASPTSSVSPGSSNVSYPSSAYTVVRRVPILSGRSRPPLTRLNSLPRKPLPALDARVFDAYSGTRLHLENPRPDMNSGNNSPESNKTGSSKSISKKRTPI